MNKIGIDTNIFIYTLDISSPYHFECNDFQSDAKNELFTTSKNISEYFAVCTKIGVDRYRMNGLYNEIKNNVKILFPSDSSLKIFEQLLEIYKPKGNRIFDFEIVSILFSNQINAIATINVIDFKNIKEIDIFDLGSYTQ